MQQQTEASALTVRVVRAYPDPDTAVHWRRFLAFIPWASHFISPEYFLDPLVRDKRPFAILASAGTDIVGCLTGWHEGSDAISGMPTHPQLAALDLPNRHLVEKALALALLKEAERSSFVSVYAWHPSLAFADLRFRSQHCNSTYVIDLTPDEDTLFQRVHPRRRNTLRKGLRAGLQVREATREEFPAFHQVLTATHARLRIPPPLPLDDLLVPETNHRLFVAVSDGRCVAGTIIRYHADGMAEYSQNASLPDSWRHNPNDLLLWVAIKWARSAGCKAFNLAGHNTLKEQYGGTQHPTFRLSRDNSFLSLRHRRESLESVARRMYRGVRAAVQGRAHTS